MSIKVMTWVWDHSETAGIDRLVLLAIADNAADDGSNAYPSLATLQHKTRVDERTVQRAVRRLVDQGALSVRFGGGEHGQNIYQVIMNKITTPAERHPRQSATPPGAAPPPPAERHPGAAPPKPSLRTKALTPGARKRGARLPEDWKPSKDLVSWANAEGVTPEQGRLWTANFCDYWRAKAGRDAAKLDWDATWRKWIRTELERAGQRHPPEPARREPVDHEAFVAARMAELGLSSREEYDDWARTHAARAQ